MVFAFLVNSVPGYAAEGIDSLPVAGTVSIDNSVPADPSSISEAAFDTDLPDSRSSAPESESTSVPADISNETKPDDVIDPASSTSRVEAETVTEPIEGSETGTDSETLLPAEIELKKIAPVDESPSETAARSADVGDIPIDEQHFPGKVFREWLLGKREGDPAILLFLCKKLCFNICNRNVREVGGALLVHVPVERIHHARHAGADGAVPVNVAAVPRAVHKAGIYRLRHLPQGQRRRVCRQAVAAVQALPGLHHSRLFQPRQHPADAGGIGADVLRQRFAAERASAVAQADQRMDGQIKRTVHSYPSFTSS